eukprot:6212739-Pleurochrysis_carterae.AAC.2
MREPFSPDVRHEPLPSELIESPVQAQRRMALKRLARRMRNDGLVVAVDEIRGVVGQRVLREAEASFKERERRRHEVGDADDVDLAHGELGPAERVYIGAVGRLPEKGERLALLLKQRVRIVLQCVALGLGQLGAPHGVLLCEDGLGRRLEPGFKRQRVRRTLDAFLLRVGLCAPVRPLEVVLRDDALDRVAEHHARVEGEPRHKRARLSHHGASIFQHQGNPL